MVACAWSLVFTALLASSGAWAQNTTQNSTSAVLPLPSWVRLRTDVQTGQRTAMLRWNRMLVDNANRNNATFDLVLCVQPGRCTAPACRRHPCRRLPPTACPCCPCCPYKWYHRWGDSTTSTLMYYPDAMAMWDAYFGFSKRWVGAIMGVSAP